MSHTLMMTAFRLRLSALCAAVFTLATCLASAQTSPTANTFSSIAGGYTGTYTAGGVCGGSSSGSTYVSIDTLGNGCPGQYAKLGASLSGMGVDGAGNVYFMDTTNAMVRKVDAKSGIVTNVAGANTNCGSGKGQNDSYGAGCPLLQAALIGSTFVRGMNVDSYGNVIVPAYSGSTVEMLCLAASPLCPNTAGHKQVGYVYRLAGCVISQTAGGTTSGGTTAYSAGDGLVASPFENLAADVTDWGAGAVVGAVGTQSCSNLAGVTQPRNATADRFGNVYIADTGNGRYRVVLGPLTSTFFAGNNPLYAILALNPKYPTPHYGYIYPIMGGFSSFMQNGITYNAPTTAGGACSSAVGAATSSDALGDGCPYFATTTGSSLAGLTVDLNGNVIFLDQAKQLVRVLYAGGTAMANLIHVTTGLTAVQGSIYAIEGFGAASLSTTPVLGTAAGNFSYDVKGAVDQYGNIYIGNYNPLAIYEIDATTGYMRTLFGTGSACAAKKDTIGDGCLAGAAPFTSAGSSIGMAIGVDNLNNVYLADNQGYIRKVLSTSLYPTAVGSSFTQAMLFHEPVGTTAISASLVNASPGITISGTPTCVLNTATTSDSTADCTVTVVFAPTTPGIASATLSITATGGGGATTLYPVSGQATDAVLVTDVASPTTSVFATFGASGNPTSLTFDNAGNLYTIEKNTTSIKKISSAGTITTVGTAPSGASQIAVDPLGNVYVTAAGSTSISKFTLSSGGTYSTATTATAAIATTTTTITAYNISGNVATFTAANTLAAGQTVTLSGFPTSTFFNGQTVTVLSAGLSTTQFEANFTNANVSATTESGYANAAAGTITPQGIVFDAQGNEYLSDATTKAVYQVPNDAGGGSFQSTVLLATGFANPSFLAFDGLGNLVVADTSAVYRINSGTGALLTLLSSVSPVAIAADLGGNVYMQDGGTKKVVEVPYQAYAPGTINVLTVETTPHGLAVDSKGQIYVADSGLTTPAILKVLRASETYTFPTATTTFTGSFTNAGNANSTGYAQTDAAEFPYTGSGSGGCGSISTTSPLNMGGACLFSVTPLLGNNGQLVTNTTTLLPATSLGSLALSAQEPAGTTYTTTTSVSGPASAVYSSGTEITFTVSEVGSDSTTQTGNISITIDSGAAYNVTLTNGAATVPLSGLSTGAHTIVASYPGNGTYLSSTSATTNFTITQASTSVAWTPGATTQQYSAAVGTAPLNATGSVPGTLIYTATPSGGSAQNIHSASFLPIGTYALGVTLVPTDSVNYAQSTASASGYTVTKATTTAAIGSTQVLLAADGTGNFTNMQAAVNAIGASGGSIYIKPGTYTGDITVVQPNVAFRGLGGDPTKVILTHAGGSFGGSSNTGVYQYAGEFTTAQNNGSQLASGSSLFTGDEGAATLVVARGINTSISSTQLIPNGFYAENLTVNNSYNTDTSTTTTTYVVGGNCTANAGAAQTYSALYNSGVECASQALAIWTTSDLTVMNNVYFNSLQDTVYTASPGSQVPSRQYYFRGKIAGDVDYIFGDAAAVFDSTSIYSAFHGTAANGTVTIEAQNKSVATGSTSDYLSGYIMNNNVFTSQAPNMTALYFGRPYGNYSTWIMLNSYVDQVAAIGYTTGLGPTLNNNTYGEFNDIQYTDPTTNGTDLNGVVYVGAGGNSGSGVTGTRENVSTNPGTVLASSNPPTSMSLAQAQYFFPTNFLSQTVSSSPTPNWNPTSALATDVNAFSGSATSANVTGNSSVTLLLRPKTPGLGAIIPTSYNPASPTPATWTIPTGTYTLSDTYNSVTTTLASGTLDASGEAYLTTSSLGAGTHSITWVYSGDSNFSGSTSAAYSLVVSGTSTTTTLSAQPTTYGQSAALTATVASASGTPTGSVTLTIDGTSTLTSTLSSGQASFSVPNLTAGAHSFSATYVGSGTYTASTTTSNLLLTISKATITVTGVCNNRIFDTTSVCSANVGSYQYSDTTATVFATTPTGTTSALRDSVSGTYAATPVATLSTFGAQNYTLNAVAGTFTISGNAPQVILFAPLSNFTSGFSYQLSARASSGLPVQYTVTTGNATVSGTTLTVTAPGLVTVQASTAADPTGDYHTATPVSVSFTAK